MGKWKASQSLEKLRKPVNKEKWSTEPAVGKFIIALDISRI